MNTKNFINVLPLATLAMGALALIATLGLTGCSPSPEAAAGGYGEAQPLVDLIKADLAERLGVGPDEITVQSVEATEFPDASLGVAEPGQVYAQVITPGYVVRLAVDGTVYEYHGSEDRVVFVPGPSSTPISPLPEGPIPVTPEGAAAGFYSWYIWYAREVGNPLVDGVYRSSEYLTEGFVQKVDGIIASFDKGGYDPFLCAQDIPESFTVDEALVSGDRASLVVHTSFEGHTFVVEAEQVNGRWAISDVICAASEDESTADWQVFSDEEYGFQVRFPEDWTYEDVPPVLPGMEVPEGMKALKRVLTFEPEDWDGVASPLNVEVTEGTAEEFGWMYAPATSTENLEVNDCAVVRATEDLGEVQVVRYIFQSPTEENVRIVVTDFISGFPERAEGHEDVVEIVQQVLSTFEFTR
jgi:hypothetical protein